MFEFLYVVIFFLMSKSNLLMIKLCTNVRIQSTANKDMHEEMPCQYKNKFCI